MEMHMKLVHLSCVLCIVFIASLAHGASGVDDPSNCLAARNDLIFRKLSSVNITMDPYVWEKVTGQGHLNATLCSTDPDPIYMSDSRCQCNAAIQWYIQDNPAANSSTAFSLYSADVDNLNPNAYTWHCEACADTVKQVQWTYVRLTVAQTCVAAREDYFDRYPAIYGANYDSVFHYEKSGPNRGRLWNSSLCDSNPQYVTDAPFRTCPQALANYVSQAWWAKYYYDPFLAYWNSFYIYGRPIYNTMLCDNSTIPIVPPPTPETILPQNATCLAARWDYFIRYPAIFISGYDAVFHYQHSGPPKNRAWNPNTCLSNPVFITDPVCQCDAAVDDFVSRYPDSASDPFAYYLAHEKIVWRCELCDGAFSNDLVVTAPVGAQDSCIAARADFCDRYPTVCFPADAPAVDPVYAYTNSEGLTWNGALCDTDPQYINDTEFRCEAAEDEYQNAYPESATFFDPFYHWAMSFQVNGAYYHYELCDAGKVIVDKKPSNGSKGLVPILLPIAGVICAVMIFAVWVYQKRRAALEHNVAARLLDSSD